MLALDKKLERWPQKKVGLVPRPQENWFMAKLELQSLAELLARSGLETELL